MEKESITELLSQLKSNIREASSPFFEDEELVTILEEYGYDLRRCSYEALLRKAEDDSIRLPSGLEVPNNSAYWLRLARRYRTNAGGQMNRVDGS